MLCLWSHVSIVICFVQCYVICKYSVHWTAKLIVMFIIEWTVYRPIGSYIVLYVKFVCDAHKCILFYDSLTLLLCLIRVSHLLGLATKISSDHMAWPHHNTALTYHEKQHTCVLDFPQNRCY